MKRFVLLTSCALLMAGSGCCLWHQYPYCGGYGSGYGGGTCPGGACPPTYGPGYPSSMYYGAGASAAVPYGYQTATSVNYLPVY